MKPHTRCYDMECDECPEHACCDYSDVVSREINESFNTIPTQETDFLVELAKLKIRIETLSQELNALAVAVNKTQAQFDLIIAAITRAVNEGSV